MNRFLRRIFWFVLPVAAAAAGAEWGLRSIPHQLGYKAAYMERHAPEIEVLSLGLSHAFYGLDFHASKFRGFNLAYHGQPLDRDLELWEKYADRLTSLRAVVISLSCWSTHHRLRKEGEQWRVPFYTINYDLPVPWYAFKERYIIAYPSPAFRYLKHALSPGDIRAEGNTPQDEFGSYMALRDNRRPDWDRRTAEGAARGHSDFDPEDVAALSRTPLGGARGPHAADRIVADPGGSQRALCGPAERQAVHGRRLLRRLAPQLRPRRPETRPHPRRRNRRRPLAGKIIRRKPTPGAPSGWISKNYYYFCRI